MVRIRLRRVGLRNQPSYRIVVADKEKPRDGRFLEIVGFYNPRTNPATIEVDEEKVYAWLKKGAQPSDSVEKLFHTVGLMERYKKVQSGEKPELVLSEAKKFYESRSVNPKTRQDIQIRKKEKVNSEQEK